MSEPEAKFEFDQDFQTAVLALICRDPEFNARTDGLLKPEYFSSELEAGIASAFIDYFAKYRDVPKEKSVITEVVKGAIVAKRIRRELVPDLPGKLKELSELIITDRPYVIDSVAKFARHQAFSRAIIESVDLIGKHKFDEAETLVKKANGVGASEALDGHNFFERVSIRRATRDAIASGAAKKTGITTGNEVFDSLLYHHGWGRKELSLYMGGPKAGKSMVLIDHAQAAALAGFNVLFGTLEVSADICEDRTDANLSEFTLNTLGMNAAEVERRVAAMKARAGLLMFHEFPSGTLQPKGLSRLLERYKGQGTKFDLIVVDYADLMAPNFRQIEPREALRTIYVDLRAIAQVENAALLTATQINREGIKAAVARMEHVGDDINKIRTADLIISINANEDEKAENERRLYFAASRNQEDGMSLRVKTSLDRAKFLSKIIGRE